LELGKGALGHATHPVSCFAAASALLLASVIGLGQGQRSAAGPSAQPAAVADERTAIALSDQEGAFIRREMRGLLESVREIIDASAAGDRVRLAETARRASPQVAENAVYLETLAEGVVTLTSRHSHFVPITEKLRLRGTGMG